MPLVPSLEKQRLSVYIQLQAYMWYLEHFSILHRDLQNNDRDSQMHQMDQLIVLLSKLMPLALNYIYNLQKRIRYCLYKLSPRKNRLINLCF